MIDPDKRKAIYLLYEEGMSRRDIARRLKVSRNTVDAIIAQKGVMPESRRKDRIEIDPELLCRLHGECSGWVQRMHEKLTEEYGIQVGYSTLTRQIRELDLCGNKKGRCEQVPDRPGAEMQHDTSPYNLEMGGRPTHVVGSLLYFRYCKIRYLKFYRSFNRFKMKCFFHEALTFWKYAAPRCIIDNTNLARLRGSGKNAVIVPEMEQFARQYGFEFVCHEIGHANRKAGNERGFYTVETNFFPGRSFTSMEDLNRQSFEWATVRMPNRPVAKTGLIPAKAFEYEQSYLIRVPPLTPPYLEHKRTTDQYGYASLDGNFYWVPGTSREDVTLLEYTHHLKIYRKRELLAEYELPADGVKNKKFTPAGLPPPKHQPAYRKKPTAEEEKWLRAVAPSVDAYLDMALKSPGAPKHRFIRQLHGLYRKLAEPLFVKTIERALRYRVPDMDTLERIAVLLMREGGYSPPNVPVDDDLHLRESYLEGRFSGEVDLTVYDKMIEDDDE